MAIKRCIICGKAFATNCGQKTCSVACRMEHYERWCKERREKLRADPERWAAEQSKLRERYLLRREKKLAYQREYYKRKKAVKPKKVKRDRRKYYERHKEEILTRAKENQARRAAEQKRLEDELWQRIFDYYLKGEGNGNVDSGRDADKSV